MLSAHFRKCKCPPTCISSLELLGKDQPSDPRAPTGDRERTGYGPDLPCSLLDAAHNRPSAAPAPAAAPPTPYPKCSMCPRVRVHVSQCCPHPFLRGHLPCALRRFHKKCLSFCKGLGETSGKNPIRAEEAWGEAGWTWGRWGEVWAGVVQKAQLRDGSRGWWGTRQRSQRDTGTMSQACPEVRPAGT